MSSVVPKSWLSYAFIKTIGLQVYGTGKKTQYMTHIWVPLQDTLFAFIGTDLYKTNGS